MNDKKYEYSYRYELDDTPAFQTKTLFIHGCMQYEEIKAIIAECEHVRYSGFVAEPIWYEQISKLLDDGYWVSLEFDVKHWGYVLEEMSDMHERFVPIVTLSMSYISLANYNTIIKIVDTDEDEKITNHGTWTHYLHDLLSRKAFRTWKEIFVSGGG